MEGLKALGAFVLVFVIIGLFSFIIFDYGVDHGRNDMKLECISTIEDIHNKNQQKIDSILEEESYMSSIFDSIPIATNNNNALKLNIHKRDSLLSKAININEMQIRYTDLMTKIYNLK